MISTLSLTAAVGEGRRLGLGGGSPRQDPRATSNKCHLEAREVCSKGFKENYILRQNLRQRENSSFAKGENKSFQFRKGSTKDSKL